MPDLKQIKARILSNEIQILKHHIEEPKNTNKTSDLYVEIEYSRNKTLLAQKKFSLSEITGEEIIKNRKTLHEEEEDLINKIEILLERNWAEFPLKDFITQRIPNFMESFISAFPKSLVEVFLPDSLKNAQNPTVRAFVRDITKIPSALMMWNKGQQIGSTKYHFDDFLLAGTLSKITCKTSLIFGLKEFIALSPEAISRISNYICEVPSRLLTKISRVYQDTHSKEEINSQTTQDRMNFALEHMTHEAVYDSVYSSISKTITTDSLGTLLGILSQVEFWTDPNHPSLSSSFFNKFFLVDVQNRNTDESNKQKPTHFINAFVNELGIEQTSPIINSFIQQVSKTFFDTFTLTPPARIMEDIPGVFKKSDLKKTGYISIKFSHFLDGNVIDTKKDYGISDFLSNHTSNHTDVMENALTSSQEAAGRLGIHQDEL